MGTNYYLRSQRCNHCGHLPEDVHLGKSSLGWCFSLHVMPECDIDSLDSMVKWLVNVISDGSMIVDEYGETRSLDEFFNIVTRRSNPRIIKDGWDSKWWKYDGALEQFSYRSEEDFHSKNMSERGPSGLLRHRIDGWHCIGHGPGTWDLIIGEFS